MTWIWTILSLCAILICSVYWYYKHSKNYLEDLGIPCVSYGAFALLSNLIKCKISSTELCLHHLEIEKFKKYGPIYGSSEMGYPVITIANPDLLRKILVKDFHVFTGRRVFISGDPIGDNFLSTVRGEKWKRIRTIVTPTFSTGKMKRITSVITNSAKTLVQNFLTKAGEPIDGKKLFNTFSMDVIASSAFGTKIYSYQDPNNRFVQEANKFFKRNFSWKMILLILFPKLTPSLGIKFFDEDMMSFFRDATLQIIEDRKTNGTVKNDFLQLLIEAEREHEREENAAFEGAKEVIADEVSELGHEEKNAEIFKPTKKYKSLSSDEILAQCLVFFLGGFDTIATTLTCAFHELAVNADIQNKLRKEIDAVVSKHSNQLTYDGTQEMKYLDCFLSETLRMYPPASRTERLADADYELEGTDITIRKGTIVVVPISAIHYNPEFYPEPNIFRPERFTSEEKASRHPYSYLPFGAGPRNCVAMRFALMEMKLCIAYVLSHLIIKKCPQTQIPLKLSTTFPLSLLSAHAIFTVEKRENLIIDDDWQQTKHLHMN